MLAGIVPPTRSCRRRPTSATGPPPTGCGSSTPSTVPAVRRGHRRLGGTCGTDRERQGHRGRGVVARARAGCSVRTPSSRRRTAERSDRDIAVRLVRGVVGARTQARTDPDRVRRCQRRWRWSPARPTPTCMRAASTSGTTAPRRSGAGRRIALQQARRRADRLQPALSLHARFRHLPHRTPRRHARLTRRDLGDSALRSRYTSINQPIESLARHGFRLSDRQRRRRAR